MALNHRAHAPVPITEAGSFPTREPITVYRQLCQKRLLQPDPAQQLAIERLQSLYRALLEYQPETGLRGWLARFGLTENGGAQVPVGLYLCGPVGRANRC
jgi:cell division protein ZapE